VSDCVAASGVVFVDGELAEGVLITLHPIDGGPIVAQGVSGPQGEFVISTHAQGDGASPGSYLLACTWGTYDVASQTYCDCRLGGKYADPQHHPKNDPIAWTLAGDTDNVPKRIELTSDH